MSPLLYVAVVGDDVRLLGEEVEDTPLFADPSAAAAPRQGLAPMAVDCTATIAAFTTSNNKVFSDGSARNCGSKSTLLSEWSRFATVVCPGTTRVVPSGAAEGRAHGGSTLPRHALFELDAVDGNDVNNAKPPRSNLLPKQASENPSK